MNLLKKLLALTLAVLCVTLCVPVAASEETAWTSTELEQCTVTVPEVNAYLYPIDQSGNVIHGLTENSINIEAQLGTEKLDIEAFKNAKDMGCLYIVLLNTASNSTGYEYLNIIKSELGKWIDDLNENDRFILISYADEFTVQLDGSESRDSAKRIIANIEEVVRNANAVPAIKEAIRLAGLEENSEPERRVLVMYDNGAFLKNGDVVCDELLNSLVTEGLPLYTLCNYTYDDIQQKMTDFAKTTGGNNIRIDGSNRAVMTEQLRSWLNSCYVLKMKGSSNDLQPRERVLSIRFSADGGEQNLRKSVLVTRNIPDNVQPTLEQLKCEDETTLELVFSEDVRGADKTDNYTITEKKTGKELKIEAAEYDKARHSVTLTMEKTMAGEYCLEIRGITDVSYEANAFRFEDGSEQYEFSVDGGSAAVWIVAGVAVVVCIAAVVLVVMNKTKKRKAEQERLEAERARAEAQRREEELRRAVQAQARVKFAEDRAGMLPVSMVMVLPNGLKSKADISVGEKFSVGRSSKRSDLSINDDMISGLHMLLSYSQGRLTVADAGSTNGTFVNGIKIDKPRQLQNGDTILIGKTRISVKF